MGSISMLKKITKAKLLKQEKRRIKRELKQRIDRWKSIIKQAQACEKCGIDFNTLTQKGKPRLRHPHHLVSERSVIKNYPTLIDDIRNGICLCSQCHRQSPDSAHEGGFEFTLFLMKKYPEKYNFLYNFLSSQFVN